jgi:inorganic triphosphatase YgiF
MPIERELKFSLLDAPPAEAEVTAVFRGSRFTVEPLGCKTHVDRYYDDGERTLARSGVALRRRRTGASEVATLKWIGTVEGAAHEREEVEGVMEEGWPAAILERLALHLQDAVLDLRPRLELTIERTSFSVRQGGSLVATLSFDDVSARYPDGERAAMFWEVELEAETSAGAAPGDDVVAALHEVAERLDRLMTLTPSSANKLERAEAMLSLGAVL